MPSTYAHFRFGQEVRLRIDKSQKSVIDQYTELYQIGLHGPDILFYNRPLRKNPVNTLGYRMHEQPGSVFFSFAAEILRKHDGDMAFLAYIYGFICHFALDVCCHPCVEEKITESGITHAEIETEFDRSLMVRDGLNPITHFTTGHIVPSEENAEIIREFYPGLTVKEMRDSLKDMVFYLNLLTAPTKMKYGVLMTAFRLIGKYDELQGHVVNREANPNCSDSNEKMYLLYKEALDLAVSLIHEYDSVLSGSALLSQKYRYNFGGIRL